MNKFRFRNGLTLIEVIIYIGITSIVLVTLLRVMLTVMGTRDKTEVISAVQQNLRFVQERVINISLNATEIVATGSTFNSNQGVLHLNMSGASISPTIFSLVNSGVYIQQGSNPAVPLTSSGVIVDQLRFTDLSASDTYGTIRVVVHATDAVEGDQATYTDSMTVQTSISLRYAR